MSTYFRRKQHFAGLCHNSSPPAKNAVLSGDNAHVLKAHTVRKDYVKVKVG